MALLTDNANEDARRGGSPGTFPLTGSGYPSSTIGDSLFDSSPVYITVTS
jgi:hypothetical protein